MQNFTFVLPTSTLNAPWGDCRGPINRQTPPYVQPARDKPFATVLWYPCNSDTWPFSTVTNSTNRQASLCLGTGPPTARLMGWKPGCVTKSLARTENRLAI